MSIGPIRMRLGRCVCSGALSGSVVLIAKAAAARVEMSSEGGKTSTSLPPLLQAQTAVTGLAGFILIDAHRAVAKGRRRPDPAPPSQSKRMKALKRLQNSSADGSRVSGRRPIPLLDTSRAPVHRHADSKRKKRAAAAPRQLFALVADRDLAEATGPFR